MAKSDGSSEDLVSSPGNEFRESYIFHPTHNTDTQVLREVDACTHIIIVAMECS